ncbi:unnamed protein product [Fraxinus pennsylvanica]|uniref:Uncharacterized protein n=1 Tax=Fraxinus pennsylvanica TaxID=56036 RepID=A0AAD1Z3C8_9LAMI|nr:unnamed protein product [Fraxinus pennsylvanica]
MTKKRARITNPEPFLADDSKSLSAASSKKRSKPPKPHQLEQKLVPSGMSSKILKEALSQQKEIQEEEEKQNPSNLVFSEENGIKDNDYEEEDIDDFGGFSETQSQFGQWDLEVLS